MSRFRRFFLRPAREPFWVRLRLSGMPGVNAFFAGLMCLGMACMILFGVTGRLPTSLSFWESLSGNPWMDLFLIVTALPFWFVGGLLSLVGGVVLCWVLMARLGARLARRIARRKEEEN